MISYKPYVREPAKTTWYLAHRRYMQHMAQELSSFFIGAYALVLLWGIKALSAGPDAYQAYLEGLSSPLALVFHWVALAVIVYHAVTWFAVTPKAMPLQLGDEFVPGRIIAGAHYAVWLAFSLFVLFIVGAL